MDASKVEQQALSPQMREGGEERRFRHGRIVVGRRSAERHDGFFTAIEPEALTRQQSLFLAGEQRTPCIAKHAVLAPGPVEPFLQMLERIAMLEPRIEHAVWKHEIRSLRSCKRPPRAKADVLPQAIDDHCIEAVGVCLQPGLK